MNGANTRIFKAVIIGAGYAGLCAAVRLADKFGGENVLLLERNDRVGKKLLLTGNGQCNISSACVTPNRYHGSSPDFCKNAVGAHGLDELTFFFEKLGVPFVNDGGKIYPMSKQASSVVDALRLRVGYLGVSLFTGEKVVKAVKAGGVFSVKTESGKTFAGESLLIACGGCVAPQTGSDGAGYALAKSFGHTVTALYPSIAKLPCDKTKIKGLAGIKQHAELTLIVGGIPTAEARGDVLFAQDAVSGNAAFSVSSFFAGCKEGVAAIDFCPDMTFCDLTDYLIEKSKNCPYLNVAELFGGIVNKKAAEAVIRNSTDINPLTVAGEADIKRAARAVKNYRVPLKPIADFVGAQATRGGVTAAEVNGGTMESKLVKNLYFAGEILDIDGDCGGFNLQWAYSSAASAAESIIKAIK